MAVRVDFEFLVGLMRKAAQEKSEHLHSVGEKMKYRTVADASVGTCKEDERLVDNLLN